MFAPSSLELDTEKLLAPVLYACSVSSVRDLFAKAFDMPSNKKDACVAFGIGAVTRYTTSVSMVGKPIKI
jgi:hypothetical protein